jgi:hypothetical protein
MVPFVGTSGITVGRGRSGKMETGVFRFCKAGSVEVTKAVEVTTAVEKVVVSSKVS